MPPYRISGQARAEGDTNVPHDAASWLDSPKLSTYLRNMSKRSNARNFAKRVKKLLTPPIAKEMSIQLVFCCGDQFPQFTPGPIELTVQPIPQQDIGRALDMLGNKWMDNITLEELDKTGI